MSMGNKFGHLCLYKNGELSFEPYSEVTDYDIKSRNEVRDDPMSVLDCASAIMSSKGGYQMSVRSGFFSTISSVKTPMS